MAPVRRRQSRNVNHCKSKGAAAAGTAPTSLSQTTPDAPPRILRSRSSMVRKAKAIAAPSKTSEARGSTIKDHMKVDGEVKVTKNALLVSGRTRTRVGRPPNVIVKKSDSKERAQPVRVPCKTSKTGRRVAVGGVYKKTEVVTSTIKNQPETEMVSRGTRSGRKRPSADEPKSVKKKLQNSSSACSTRSNNQSTVKRGSMQKQEDEEVGNRRLNEEIEYILRTRVNNGRTQGLVKWKDNDHKSWVYQDNFPDPTDFQRKLESGNAYLQNLIQKKDEQIERILARLDKVEVAVTRMTRTRTEGAAAGKSKPTSKQGATTSSSGSRNPAPNHINLKTLKKNPPLPSHPNIVKGQTKVNEAAKSVTLAQAKRGMQIVKPKPSVEKPPPPPVENPPTSLGIPPPSITTFQNARNPYSGVNRPLPYNTTSRRSRRSRYNPDGMQAWKTDQTSTEGGGGGAKSGLSNCIIQ